jgi:peptidyl-tRNA hydrolase, PTH1 family
LVAYDTADLFVREKVGVFVGGCATSLPLLFSTTHLPFSLFVKYLIVGLGNPGPEYEDTRHNAGFMVIQRLLQRFETMAESKRYASVATVKHRGRQLLTIMPSTYMNLSGKAVRYYLDQETIPLERCLIVYDDLALPFGQLRMRAKGSDGGHNGLKHINEVLGRQDYPRLRVGIGDDFPKGRQVDYVLDPFSEAEQAELPDILDRGVEAILSFVSIGIARTMTEVNRKD